MLSSQHKAPCDHVMSELVSGTKELLSMTLTQGNFFTCRVGGGSKNLEPL